MSSMRNENEYVVRLRKRWVNETIVIDMFCLYWNMGWNEYSSE